MFSYMHYLNVLCHICSYVIIIHVHKCTTDQQKPYLESVQLQIAVIYNAINVIERGINWMYLLTVDWCYCARCHNHSGIHAPVLIRLREKNAVNPGYHKNGVNPGYHRNDTNTELHWNDLNPGYYRFMGLTDMNLEYEMFEYRRP